MIKKIFSVLTLASCLTLAQNASFGQEEYDAQSVYLRNMEHVVGLNWLKPINTDYKSAVIYASLDKDGKVRDVKLLRSSKDDSFDKSAIGALYKSEEFGPLKTNDEFLNAKIFISPVFIDATATSYPNVQNNIVDVAYTNSNIDSYKANLEEKINTNWNPKYLRKSKEAIAEIEIGKNGSLNNIELVKSSRHKKFDREMLDTISKSVPFAALPDSINSDTKKVQLVFQYDKVDKQINHQVVANIRNLNSYDKYKELVEEIIANAHKDRIKDNLIDRRYFWYKDLVLELNIDKNGKVNYVKVDKPSKDWLNFDRKTLTRLQQASFPPIPDEMGTDNITIKYEVVTQRGRKFKDDFLNDYAVYLFTRRLKSFCL